MPPKRASPSTAAGPAGANKKAKPRTAKADPKPSDRWSAVSASRNADEDYKLAMRDPELAYSYICMCKPSLGGDDSEDEFYETGDDSDGEDPDAEPKPKCDGGELCLCSKPAAEHPDHTWTVSNAGFRKYLTQSIHAALRCPDNFDMYTYNDHQGYGVLQVVQNLLLDFVEAKSNLREQWAVCEGMVLFLLGFDSPPMFGIDDSDTLNITTLLIGRTFLTMLAGLESQGLLKEDSEIKNIGVVMALYMMLAVQFRQSDVLEAEDEPKSKKKQTGKKSSFEFDPSRFDDYVVAYANKYAIPLQGPENIDDIAADCDGTVELPVATPADPDPWGFAAAMLKYERECGTASRRGKKAAIGGDSLDITTWSSAERKAHSFNNKDPLGKKELDAIKEGMVMQPA